MEKKTRARQVWLKLTDIFPLKGDEREAFDFGLPKS